MIANIFFGELQTARYIYINLTERICFLKKKVSVHKKEAIFGPSVCNRMPIVNGSL